MRYSMRLANLFFIWDNKFNHFCIKWFSGLNNTHNQARDKIVIPYPNNQTTGPLEVWYYIARDGNGAGRMWGGF